MLRGLRANGLARAVHSLASAAIVGSAGGLYTLRVGLEVHAQILSETKLFSDAPAAGSEASAAGPNTCVSLFDAALPGSLPTVNRHCVVQAVRAGLMLGGEVQRESVFERKHYFYADLPAGYQITQRRFPVVRGGSLLIDVPSGPQQFARERVRIERIQLEQDSGKSSHTLHPVWSLVDLNRAGVGLLEIVTMPDLASAEAAGAFLRKLQTVLRHGGICDGNMELGSMRCDVNVSLHPITASQRGDAHLLDISDLAPGERVEMKNVSSVRAVVRAVEHETKRQLEFLERGEAVARETRSFDLGSNSSAHLRGKEDAPDYRFLAEPDLRPLIIPPSLLQLAQRSLPESLDRVRERLSSPPHGLSDYDASVIVGTPGGPRFFDEALDHAVSVWSRERPGESAPLDAVSKQVCNWLTTEVLGRLNDRGASLIETGSGGVGRASGGIAFTERESHSPRAAADAWWSPHCHVSPHQVGEVAALAGLGVISGAACKEVLGLLFGERRRGEAASPEEVADARGRSITSLIEARGLRQVNDVEQITGWCRAALRDPRAAKPLDKVAKGRDRARGALVAIALELSGGAGNPGRIAQAMNELLVKEGITKA
jgi:aspartyl-tRNA(Asn)/glutamyl-tRNA(Gln) amidotransferase subunit B